MKNARTNIYVIIIAISIILLAFASGHSIGMAHGANDIMNHVYPSCGTVVEVDYAKDIIVIEDCVNHTWIWTGAEDWNKGDIAAMIMDDNGTEEVYDDIIVDIHYEGT